MSLNMFKKKKISKETNLLDLTPFRFYGEETDSEGNVVVLIPKFKNKILVRHLLPRMKSKFFKLKLDKFGSAVWLLIDGRNNVKFIAGEVVNKFGDEIQPVYERLPKFITMLFTNNLISFNEIESKGE